MRTIVLVVVMLFCMGTAEGASFTLTIPDGILTDVVEAFSVKFNYQEEVSNPAYNPEDPESLSMIPNPVSKTGFAKLHLKRLVRDIYLEVEMRKEEKIIREKIDSINEVTQEITVE